MIGDALPDAVRFAESRTDPAGITLFPEEQEVIRKAVPKRLREFTTVRHCARQALAALGYPAGPLVPGERGAPVWPDGLTGSMTHCSGYRAAAIAHRDDLASIGIDAEPNGPLPVGVLEAVALPEEHRNLDRLRDAAPGVHWDRLLFSAKESVYKTWFPLTGAWLGFEDAAISIDPDSGGFHARILVHHHDDAGRPLHELHGRWLSHNGLIITATTYPATP